jgi:hypothetical protein
MAFPPLKDPLEDLDGPEDHGHRKAGNPGPDGTRPTHDAEAPGGTGRNAGNGDDSEEDERSASPGSPEAAPPPAASDAPVELPPDGSDDDDLEELSELVDLSEFEEFDDLVEHRAHNAPLPPDPGSVTAAAAGDIPMLTEVVQVPRYDTEDLPQTLAEVDWGDLGQRVRENVLERLLRRSDALLDAQLQNTLTPVLERAAETVAHELHDALNRMIRDIVARAVTEELTRLHAEIAKRNRSSRPN